MKHLNLLIAILSYATACVLFLLKQYYSLKSQTDYIWMYYVVILLIILGIFFSSNGFIQFLKKRKLIHSKKINII